MTTTTIKKRGRHLSHPVKLTVRLSPRQSEALTEIAAKRGQGIAALVRETLAASLRRFPKD
jgi:predicted HicB family RNase H-like nuclease